MVTELLVLANWQTSFVVDPRGVGKGHNHESTIDQQISRPQQQSRSHLEPAPPDRRSIPGSRGARLCGLLSSTPPLCTPSATDPPPVLTPSWRGFDQGHPVHA